MGSVKRAPLCAFAGIILLGWGKNAGAFNDPVVDSSVGKKPYLVMASAGGSFGGIGGWDNWSRSFLGKPASVVASEGPPPRSHALPSAALATRDFFYVYANHLSHVNHFQSIGYMGDYQDIRVSPSSLEDPADGRSCIKITYDPSAESHHGWAGVYWLDPKTNWGYKPGGYNLSRMSRLTFWARGAQGGEQIAQFKVGGVEGNYADTDSAVIGPVWLTKEWRQYTIDLRDVDLTKVSGGFAWSTSGSNNTGAIAFYLDEIRYER